MRNEGRGRLVARYVSAILIVYGALGVAVQLRLLPLLVAGLGAWSSPPAVFSSPVQWGPLGPLQGHFDSLPWLPWAAWLVGIGLLSASGRDITYSTEVRDASPSRRTFWLSIAILAVLVVIGGYARMAELWPQQLGLSQFPYDDEGVYAGASQLFVQGIMPYRDYFFAHPPIAAISYAPAMVYHFTEWGSPTSFMIARYLSVAYSLVTLGLIFLIGQRLAGLWGGALSGALWALDGRVVEINRKVMLDGPMVLLSCGALLLYLWARPIFAGNASERGPGKPLIVMLFVGLLATMSALTKIAGAACLLAILADLVWIHLDNRRSRVTQARLKPQLLSLFAGVAIALGIFIAPFLILAPANFVRDVLLFQMLRPSDGLIDVPARIADISSTFANALTPLFAALGFLGFSLYQVMGVGDRGSGVGNLQINPKSYGYSSRAVVLWAFFSLLLFTYSRSFYSHYYIQLAAPLCLLGAGVSLYGFWILDFRFWIDSNYSGSKLARYLPAALTAVMALVIGLPLVGVQWSGLTSRHEDRIFELVGKYVNDAVKPGTPVLTTDEQFNFLAARPPSRNATGYLIDSYGHMIALGLGLNKRDWGDLLGASLKGTHGNDAYAVMQSAAPQADFLDRANRVPLIVLHQKGLARLTPATLAAIEARNRVVEKQARYTIYRAVR